MLMCRLGRASHIAASNGESASEGRLTGPAGVVVGEGEEACAAYLATGCIIHREGGGGSAFRL